MAGEVLGTELHEYFVTFGVQYPNFTHPVFPKISGNGYFVIEAPTEERARIMAFAIFDDKWAFVYTEVPEPKYAPLGEIGRVSISGDLK